MTLYQWLQEVKGYQWYEAIVANNSYYENLILPEKVKQDIKEYFETR